MKKQVNSYHCLDCGAKVYENGEHECNVVKCSYPRNINESCKFRGGTLDVPLCNFPEGFCPRVGDQTEYDAATTKYTSSGELAQV